MSEYVNKTAVLSYGRLNPPTIGHAKLVEAIKSQPGDHYLFLSRTHNSKSDPLDVDTKIKFANCFFSDITIDHAANPIQALEKLKSIGYSNIIFVVGSDRVSGFSYLFNTYNGKADRTGKIPFEFNSIKVVSAGNRDPSNEDASGASASKMRAAASKNDFEYFSKFVPEPSLSVKMYDAVRRGMELVNTEEKEVLL